MYMSIHYVKRTAAMLSVLKWLSLYKEFMSVQRRCCVHLTDLHNKLIVLHF